MSQNQSFSQAKSKQKSIFNLLCCCCCQSEELEIPPIALQQQQQQPNGSAKSKHHLFNNELKFIGILQRLECCTGRYTLKNFSLERKEFSKTKQSNNKLMQDLIIRQHQISVEESLSIRTALFSIANAAQIRIFQEDYYVSLPEEINYYIASRISAADCKIVVDGMCESGNLSIMLAKCDIPYVYGFELTSEQIQNCSWNSEVYQADHITKFEVGEFQDIIMASADAVIIKPKYTRIDTTESIIETCIPNIDQILHKALSMSENVVIIFPNIFVPEEIGQLLSRFIEKYPILRKIEVEFIKMSGTVISIIVYIGALAQTKEHDELAFLALSLVNNQNSKLLEPTIQIISHCIVVMGYARTLRLIQNVISTTMDEHQKLFQFKQQLIHQGIYTQMELEKIYPNESVLEQLFEVSHTGNFGQSGVTPMKQEYTFGTKERISYQ